MIDGDMNQFLLKINKVMFVSDVYILIAMPTVSLQVQFVTLQVFTLQGIVNSDCKRKTWVYEI
jgi:hypothetical protein